MKPKNFVLFIESLVFKKMSAEDKSTRWFKAISLRSAVQTVLRRILSIRTAEHVRLFRDSTKNPQNTKINLLFAGQPAEFFHALWRVLQRVGGKLL